MKLLATHGAVFAVLAASLPALAQTTWTVAPTGPADFPSVAAALPVVAPGDVLLLAPGDYGSVLLTKALTLMGSQDAPTRPRFNSISVVGVAWTELFHLETNFLAISQVPGRSRVEDVRVLGGTEFSTTGQLFVRGCEFFGAPNARALWVSGGVLGPIQVQIIDSTIRGGNSTSTGGGFPIPPGVGIEAPLSAASRLTLVGTDVFGGSNLNGGIGAVGAPALVASLGGFVEVRGSSFHRLYGGTAGPGLPPTTAVSMSAFSVAQIQVGDNLDVQGGVSPAVQWVPARPYSQWTGTGGPGSNRNFEVYGPSGDLAVVFLGLGALYDGSAIPAFGQPLTVDLASVLLTPSQVLLGQDLPASLGIALPPSPGFAGLAVPTQGAVVDLLDFSVQLTNGDDLLVSF